MTNASSGSNHAVQTQSIKTSWLGKHRMLSAVLLHGLWKLQWYQTVFLLWPMILAAAWGASPYFMVYVVGMPEPGTAPRYVGTIRFEGELQRTKTGWIPPKYFIQTSKGDVEFHCRYRPSKNECWFNAGLGSKPNTDDVYEIGYDPYWGLDYIKYPPKLSKLDEYGDPKLISSERIGSLKNHKRDAVWLCFLFLSYISLIWLAYQKSAPKQPPEPPAKPYPFEPETSSTDSKPS
jgi:hypothetical protein